ncbi:MAG: enoyl-CoA hydratase/isomerase family protein [Rhodospirillales bacterium]|nr:enoyl-CoA hydratase/isomerase family protein [Rhodospirillales bacterium]
MDKISNEPVIQSIDGVIGTIVLNNPAKLNAMSLAMWAELGRAMVKFSDNADLRCVVVRGAGDRAFSAGADIAEFPEIRNDAAQAREYGKVVADSLEAIRGCIHPTIAAIQGACTGGGLEVACGCDMRISNTSGRFGVPINRLGHSFAYAEMATVLTAIDRTLVLEIIYEGRILDSDEALRRGLLNRVVADLDFEDEIQATTARIARGAPLTHRATKKFLARLAKPEPLTQAEIDEGYALCDSDDYAEGVRAFLAKEKPTFEGK